MKLYNLSLYAILSVLAACASSEKSDQQSDSKEKRSAASASRQEDDEFYVSGNLETLTMSLSNNPLTSKRIDKREASNFAAKLESAIKASKGDDRKGLVALMSLRRISGEGLGPVMEVARQLVAFEMKKNVNREIPEFAKLELALAAIQAKKYSFAEYFIAELSASKNKKIKASALTAEGIIAAQDDRLPEAVESWSKALEVDGSFEPALLNIGFVALKYGDFPRAKKMLGSMQGDWFSAYGLVTAERMTKDPGKAAELCKKVLSAKPTYKPALYNCALNTFEGENKPEEAIALLDKMTKVAGNNGWDEKAYALKQRIEREAAKKRTAAPPAEEKKKK